MLLLRDIQQISIQHGQHAVIEVIQVLQGRAVQVLLLLHRLIVIEQYASYELLMRGFGLGEDQRTGGGLGVEGALVGLFHGHCDLLQEQLLVRVEAAQ